MNLQERPAGAISGNLEDVVVSDLLQFIQLGKRTGTLVLRVRDETARIGFHRGRLIAAQAPRAPRIREALATTGLVDQATLERLASDDLRRVERRDEGLIGGDYLELQEIGRGVGEVAGDGLDRFADLLRRQSEAGLGGDGNGPGRRLGAEVGT